MRTEYEKSGKIMPTISMFYGIIIRMLYMDTQRHNLPHLHVEYQGMKSVISLPEGEIIEGELPRKMRVQKLFLHSPEVRDQKSEVSKTKEL